MPDEKSKAAFCPNCQQPAIRIGNEVTCGICDAIFVITKKNGAKVKKLGPIEDHEQRLKTLESKILPEEPEPAEQQGGEDDDEPELENDSKSQDQEILGPR